MNTPESGVLTPFNHPDIDMYLHYIIIITIIITSSSVLSHSQTKTCELLDHTAKETRNKRGNKIKSKFAYGHILLPVNCYGMTVQPGTVRDGSNIRAKKGGSQQASRQVAGGSIDWID